MAWTGSPRQGQLPSPTPSQFLLPAPQGRPNAAVEAKVGRDQQTQPFQNQQVVFVQLRPPSLPPHLCPLGFGLYPFCTPSLLPPGSPGVGSLLQNSSPSLPRAFLVLHYFLEPASPPQLPSPPKALVLCSCPFQDFLAPAYALSLLMPIRVECLPGALACVWYTEVMVTPPPPIPSSPPPHRPLASCL